MGFKFVLDDNTEEVRFRFDPSRGGDKKSCTHPILHTISNKMGWVMMDLVTNEVLVTPVHEDRGLPLLNLGRNQTSFDKENLILKGGTGYMITALQLVKKNFTKLEHIHIYDQYCMNKKEEYQKSMGNSRNTRWTHLL